MAPQTLITGIYILATVFGVGVIAVEMLGLLGDFGEDGGGDGGDAADATDGADGETNQQTRPGMPPPRPRPGGAGQHRSARRLFALLWYMRLLVYFAFGFGLMGLGALLAGSEPWMSLGWAVPAGLVIGGASWAFLRFQQREFDSSVQEDELVGRAAKVIVSILPGEIGKVRIQFEQLVRDRFARGHADDAEYHKGAQVVVKRVTDKCVYVAAADEIDADSDNNKSASNRSANQQETGA